MPLDDNGRWLSVEETIRQINDRRLDVQDHKAEAKRPKADPAVEVRGFYERLVGSPTRKFGPTSFEMGRGLTDQKSFDMCVDEFGFMVALRALVDISQRAGQLRGYLEKKNQKSNTNKGSNHG